MDLGAAIVCLVTVGLFKVGVMVVTAGLLFRLFGTLHRRHPRRLWLLVPEEDRPEVRGLFVALVLFAVSELTCGIEIWVVFGSSLPLGIAHSITSALGMGLFAAALVAFLDRRLFSFAARGCLGNRVCRGCPVVEGQACRYRALLQLVAGFVALACVPPWFASTTRMLAEPRRYLLPFPSLNAWYDHTLQPWIDHVYPSETTGVAFSIPPALQIFDWRGIPTVAFVLAVAAIVLLGRRREALGLRVLAFGFGMLAYSYFEMVVYRISNDPIFGGLAHEVAELWFVAVTAELLARTFPARPRSSAST